MQALLNERGLAKDGLYLRVIRDRVVEANEVGDLGAELGVTERREEALEVRGDRDISEGDTIADEERPALQVLLEDVDVCCNLFAVVGVSLEEAESVSAMFICESNNVKIYDTDHLVVGNGVMNHMENGVHRDANFKSHVRDPLVDKRLVF